MFIFGYAEDVNKDISLFVVDSGLFLPLRYFSMVKTGMPACPFVLTVYA